MKKKVVILLALLGQLSFQEAIAQELSTQWAIQIGGANDDRCVKILSIDSNSVYFTGIINDKTIINSGGAIDSSCYNTQGYEDIILGRLSYGGQILWIKHLGGIGVDFPSDIIMGPDKHLILAGMFQDTLTIDSNTIVSRDYIDSFVANFDTLGNLIWMKQFGGRGNDQITSVFVDGQNNIIIGGFFNKSLELLGDSLGAFLSPCNYKGFVCQMSPYGQVNWFKTMLGRGQSIVEDVITDKFDEYYITGTFKDSILIDGSSVYTYSHGGSDVFIAKYDYDGEGLWLETFGGVCDDVAKSIIMDGVGKLIATGEFKGDLVHENKVIESSTDGSYDIFLLSLNKNGNLQWSNKNGFERNDYVFDSWLPHGEEFLMATDIRYEIDTTNLNIYNKNISLASFELFGNLSDSIETGSDFNPIILSSTIDWQGNIYFCGNFKDSISFDQIGLVSKGEQDIFLLKLGIPSNSPDNMSNPESLNESITFNPFSVDMDALGIDSVQLQNQSFYLTNYPNPFTDRTVLVYNLPEPCTVNLLIYDIEGNLIKRAEYFSQTRGIHYLELNGAGLNAGIYSCRLLANGTDQYYSQVVKLIRIH